MARNTTLQVLLDDLRSEAGHAISASLGQATEQMMLKLLNRVQRRLWEDFSWPFLHTQKDIVLQAGQRYYNVPSGITLERIETASFKYGGAWVRVKYGIDPSHYNQYDSDRDTRSWPIMRYRAYGDVEGQVEVWPIPSNNGDASTGEGTLRLKGVKNLNPLSAKTDTADLDDQLIVLFAAGELLARQKSADAQMKLMQANQHYLRVKGRLSKGEPIVFGDAEPDRYRSRGPIPIARVS
jgi:hypothetical protein